MSFNQSRRADKENKRAISEDKSVGIEGGDAGTAPFVALSMVVFVVDGMFIPAKPERTCCTSKNVDASLKMQNETGDGTKSSLLAIEKK